MASLLVNVPSLHPVLSPTPLVNSSSFPPLKLPDPPPLGPISRLASPSSISVSTTIPISSSTLVDASTSKSVVAPSNSWARLFHGKPRSAGRYEPKQFVLNYSGGPLVAPIEIRQEGIRYWDRHLVGFCVGKRLSYTTVTTYIRRVWKPKLKGEFEIKSDGKSFFFDFASVEDRVKILQADPLFIKGEMFVITRWDPSFGSVAAQIRSIPIWVHIHNIPLIFWTLLGINWLACHVGKVVCFNDSTERMVRFEYAKVLIEISPDKELPSCLDMSNLGAGCPNIKLLYDWIPSICTNCKVFGHDTAECVSVQNKAPIKLGPLSNVDSHISIDGNLGKVVEKVKLGELNSNKGKEVDKAPNMRMDDKISTVVMQTKGITSSVEDWSEVRRNRKKNRGLSRFAVKKAFDPSMKRKIVRPMVNVDKCATTCLTKYRDEGESVTLDPIQARHCAKSDINTSLNALEGTGIDVVEGLRSRIQLDTCNVYAIAPGIDTSESLTSKKQSDNGNKTGSIIGSEVYEKPSSVVCDFTANDRMDTNLLGDSNLLVSSNARASIDGIVYDETGTSETDRTNLIEEANQKSSEPLFAEPDAQVSLLVVQGLEVVSLPANLQIGSSMEASDYFHPSVNINNPFSSLHNYDVTTTTPPIRPKQITFASLPIQKLNIPKSNVLVPHTSPPLTRNRKKQLTRDKVDSSISLSGILPISKPVFQCTSHFISNFTND